MKARTTLNVILTVFVCAFAVAVCANGKTIYVDADAAGANDGSSWADAYNYLQDALMFAVTGDEIRVAQGVYRPDDFVLSDRPSRGRDETFQLINGVTLKGGYAGFGEPDPDARDIELYKTILSGGPAAVYDPCNVVIWGDGNIDTDPCFADPGYWDPNGTPEDANDDFWVDGDYHLKSQAGRWDANEVRWVIDDVTSPCIDAGAPMSPIGLEPFPNGGVINMGAYGGTAEASKSYFGGPPCETIVAGDVNGDCAVDFKDFVLMALHWLGGR